MSLTNDDLQKIQKLIQTNNDSLASKKDIQDLYRLIPVAIDTQLDIKLEKHFDKADAQLTQMKSEIMTGIDGVMKELVALRETQEVHAKQHSDINDKFDLVGPKLKLDLSY